MEKRGVLMEVANGHFRIVVMKRKQRWQGRTPTVVRIEVIVMIAATEAVVVEVAGQ